jgi:MFS family permease
MTNYWRYFFSSVFSLMSINSFLIAQGWQIYELTGERMAVSTFWVLFMLPGILLLPYVGKFLESEEMPKPLIWLEITKAVFFFAFGMCAPYFHSVEFFYLGTVIVGLTIAPLYPSIYYMISRISTDVEDKDGRLSNIFELAVQFSSLLGAPLAGVLYPKVGFANLLLISSVLNLVSGALIWKIRFVTVPKPNPDQERLTFLSAFRLLRKSLGASRVWFVALHMVPQNAILVLTVPFVVYVSSVMKEGPEVLGYIEFLFSLVALVTSLLVAKIKFRFSGAYILIGIGAATMLSLYHFIPPTMVAVTVVTALAASLLNMSKLATRTIVINMVSSDQMIAAGILFQTIGALILVSFSYLSTMTLFGSTGGFLALGIILALLSWPCFL